MDWTGTTAKLLAYLKINAASIRLHKQKYLHGTSDTLCAKLTDEGLLAEEQHGYECQQHCCMYHAIAYICSLELHGSTSAPNQEIIVCQICL